MHGVRLDEDSSSVVAMLGALPQSDSLGWHHAAGLALLLDGSRVRIVSLQSPTELTARGLKVGDSFERVLRLYAPCFVGDDGSFVQVCYGDPDGFDERAITIFLESHLVTRIDLGRILEP